MNKCRDMDVEVSGKIRSGWKAKIKDVFKIKLDKIPTYQSLQ